MKKWVLLFVLCIVNSMLQAQRITPAKFITISAREAMFSQKVVKDYFLMAIKKK